MQTLIVRLSFVFAVTLFFGGCATEQGPSGRVAEEQGPSGKAVEGFVESSTSATLTWDAPATNTDGSPLKDLAGYNVYYGPVSGKPDTRKMKTLLLEDEQLFCKKIKKGKEKKARTECTYTVRGLSPAPHFFKVTAFSKAGKESDFSNEVQK